MSGCCKDCEHWDRRYPSIGYCELAFSDKGGAFPGNRDSRAVAIADDGGYAELKTDPYFGCNQFQEK